jgi:hypothetical protein
VTSDGIIVFFGGTVRDDYYDAYQNGNYAYYGDVWASFDGGLSWKECTGGHSPHNRTEAAVTLDNEGYMMMAAGYSLATRGRRDRPVQVWNNDVVRSDFSLQRDDEGRPDRGRQLAIMCGVDYPASGPGLQAWPSPQWNARGGAIAGVVCMIVFVLILTFGFIFTKHNVARHGSLQWPSLRDVKKRIVHAAAMPDLSFITNLALAPQYTTQEGQTNAQHDDAAAADDLTTQLLSPQQSEQSRGEGLAE